MNKLHIVSVQVLNFNLEFWTIPVWAREEAIGQAEYSKNIGPPIQRFFEKYFDIPFPLPKQDMIAVPGFGGAMENWGLITYRWKSLTLAYLVMFKDALFQLLLISLRSILIHS